MSVHVISWVLAHSDAKLGNRLVLIVLADHANADGTGAYPAVSTIAKEARLSERQVQRCLRELEAAGEVVKSGKTKRGTNVWRVSMTGRQSVTPDGPQMSPPGVTPMSPEPSLGTVQAATTEVVAAPTAANTVVADVVDVFSAHDVPLPKRHRGMIGRQAAELLDSGFDRELVVIACVTAIRRGEPQNAHFIASDLALTHAGQRITRREYEKALEDEMAIAAQERRRRGAA